MYKLTITHVSFGRVELVETTRHASWDSLLATMKRDTDILQRVGYVLQLRNCDDVEPTRLVSLRYAHWVSDTGNSHRFYAIDKLRG